MMLDVVLINPGDRKAVYQQLGNQVSAIEPPFLVAVCASYLRQKGYSVGVIDSAADNLTPQDTASRVAECIPKLVVVIVYGSQPSASTQNMGIAGRICTAVRENTDALIAIGGLHPSALPERTLREESVDFVVDGEGFLTLDALLPQLRRSARLRDYAAVGGLWWWEGGKVRHTARYPVVADLDSTLPSGAWDLLPMEKYRAHNWHCFGHLDQRSPYAAIYTSLGCPFHCSFCCINAPFGKPGIRYRSPELVLGEIDHLVECYGVAHLKIIDELFILKEGHYLPIVNGLIERGHGINIWAYARLDTIREAHLDRLKQAGINWLALGIEAGNQAVRDDVQKGGSAVDVRGLVRRIQDAGISVIGNFMFGLPEDTHDTMQETLDLAVELNCEFANMYCAMAYPGSQLYSMALAQGWELPETWEGYSQHSYDTTPLPTKHISAAEVLAFRDQAFSTYFGSERYLDMVAKRFDLQSKEHLEAVTRIKLRRRLLESPDTRAPQA